MRNLMPYAGVLLAAFLVQAPSAQALTMKECSAKYNAAKSAGTLKGMKWNEFRKAECGSAEQGAAAPAPNAGNTAANNPAPNASRTSSRKVLNSAAAPARAGNAVFPSSVSAKYASESAGKARMQTCLDQYNANKATGGNAGLKWIEKGGGYYSQCNSRLKG
jgi:hypothetical protein